MGNSKKIVSISMVKNECDIIELFIRYNLKFLDEMYIVEHMSTDGTLDILLRLKEEGLPINIFKYTLYSFNQGEVLTSIQQSIMNENKADFILCFDADEFIYAPSKEWLLEVLENEKNYSCVLQHVEYNPKEGDENKDIPILDKFRYKHNGEYNGKVIINTQIYGNREIYVGEGGHNILDKSGYIPLAMIPSKYAYLAHFAYRSKEQMLSKTLIGSLVYMIINPEYKDGVLGTHWFDYYKKVIDNGELEDVDIHVASQEGIDAGKYSLQPLHFDGELKYIDKMNVDVLENGINFALGYIRYNNDEDKRKDLVDYLTNIDKSNRDAAIISVIKTMENYIYEKFSQQ